MFRRLLSTEPGQQVYILGQLFFSTLGCVATVDDGEVPFERLMKVLTSLPRDINDTFNSRLVARLWNDLEHPTRYWPGIPFCSADGSNNSHIYPHMGVSNTTYTRSIARTFQQTRFELPNRRALFHDTYAIETRDGLCVKFQLSGSQ